MQNTPMLSFAASKSILTRLFVIASQTQGQGPIVINGWSNCTDIVTQQQGYAPMLIIQGNRQKADASKPDSFILTPQPLPAQLQLHITDAAAAYRFIVARLAFQPGVNATISVSPQLGARPQAAFFDLLQTMGAKLNLTGTTLHIKGQHLNGGVYRLPGQISSQYISALLLAAPLLKNGLELHLNTGQVSLPYINMSCQLMRDCGVTVVQHGFTIKVAAGQKYVLLQGYVAEPDYSSAGVFWALGAASQAGISVKVHGQSSLQPDFYFYQTLQQLGAIVSHFKGNIVVQKGQLLGGEFDLTNMPDQAPNLAVLGLFCQNPLTITGIGHLRHKESNRLDALVTQLAKTGAGIQSGSNWLSITAPKHIKPATLNNYHDHRLAMAFALLKRLAPAVDAVADDCVDKSFPSFYSLWNSL